MPTECDNFFWLQLNAGDFLSKTSALSVMEIGAYTLCLVYLIRHDFLPTKITELRRITRGANNVTIERICGLFIMGEFGLYDAQIKTHKEEVKKTTQQKKIAGEAGATARWSKRNQTTMTL